MVCVLKRVNIQAIEAIETSPEKAVALLGDSADSLYPVEEIRLPGCLGLLLRLTPIKVEQVVQRPKGEPLPRAVEDPERFDTEVWDVINFLLTGDATRGEPSASFLVSGGKDIETEDDDAHIRFFTPQEVGEINRHLQSLSLDDLQARMDVPEMVKQRLLSRPRKSEDSAREEEYLEGVLRDFEELRKFVAGTASQSDGLLVMIN